MEISPYTVPLIILLAIWTEFRVVILTTEEARSEAEGEGRHEQSVDSLLSKLSL